jgi:hypothetical protein
MMKPMAIATHLDAPIDGAPILTATATTTTLPPPLSYSSYSSYPSSSPSSSSSSRAKRAKPNRGRARTLAEVEEMASKQPRSRVVRGSTIYKNYLRDSGFDVGMTLRQFDTFAFTRWKSLDKNTKDIYVLQARLKNDNLNVFNGAREEACDVNWPLELADLPPLLPC